MAVKTPVQDTPMSKVPAMGKTSDKKKQFSPQKKKKWIKNLVIAAVCLAAAGFLVHGFLAGGKKAAASGYVASTAEFRDLTISVTGPGTITPNDSYQATALVKGEILTAPFEEGDEIHKDDVLYTIDAADVESAIRQAKTSVEQASLSVQSAENNYNALLRNQSDNARDRQVKANADGIITKLYVDPGDTIAAGTPIADILDRENMELEVPFHAADAAGFTVGLPATVSVSGTAETINGTIHEIAAADLPGPGGTLVRNVTVIVQNPGALTDTMVGTASVNGISSAASAPFRFHAKTQLMASYSGTLERLDVAEGTRVAEDQIIGVFKDKNMQDQVNSAAIGVENAQLTLKNAQNSLKRTEDSLEDYTITSPIDGTVIELNYNVGDNFDPSALASTPTVSPYMAVVYDMSRLTFDINVDELDVVLLKEGQEVRFTADALEGREFTGLVEKININGNTVNGSTTYPVTIAVEGEGKELVASGLYPGMNVSANIIVEEVGSVLCVPVDAVDRDNTVLVAGKGALNDIGQVIDPNKLEKRPVTIGRNNADYVEITSGLEEGETVFIINTSSNMMNAMTQMMGG